MKNSEKGKKLAEIQENERKNGFFWGGAFYKLREHCERLKSKFEKSYTAKNSSNIFDYLVFYSTKNTILFNIHLLYVI
jgi:hypothetical protein